MSLAQVELPLFQTRVAAGFPSPADDFIETSLNLHTHLVKHPAATFFVRASGDSMIETGIFDGDLLVVDRSLEVINDKVIIAAIDGQLTVKRFLKKRGKIFLIPENKKYQPIEVYPNNNFEVWGVVTHVIHPL